LQDWFLQDDFHLPIVAHPQPFVKPLPGTASVTEEQDDHYDDEHEPEQRTECEPEDNKQQQQEQ
jgi:hypothetical protein